MQAAARVVEQVAGTTGGPHWAHLVTAASQLKTFFDEAKKQPSVYGPKFAEEVEKYEREEGYSKRANPKRITGTMATFGVTYHVYSAEALDEKLRELTTGVYADLWNGEVGYTQYFDEREQQAWVYYINGRHNSIIQYRSRVHTPSIPLEPLSGLSEAHAIVPLRPSQPLTALPPSMPLTPLKPSLPLAPKGSFVSGPGRVQTGLVLPPLAKGRATYKRHLTKSIREQLKACHEETKALKKELKSLTGRKKISKRKRKRGTKKRKTPRKKRNAEKKDG